MTRESLLFFLWLALPLCLGSCGRPPGKNPEPPVEEWAISSEPSVSLLLSPDDYCGTVHMGDGRFVVCDKELDALRLFEGGGGSLGVWGGKGENLGEFRILVRISLWDGDSILAVDRFRLSGTVFSANGTPARRFEYAVPHDLSGILETRGILPGGAILSSSTLRPKAPQESLEWALTEGPVPDSVEFGVVDENGYEALGRTSPGGEYRVHGGRSTHLLAPPFGNHRLVAIGASAWATAWSHDLRVTVRARSGHKISSFPVAPLARVPNAAEVEAIRTAWLDDSPEQGLYHRQRLLELTKEEGSPPRIAGLFMGPGDEVWLTGPTIPGTDASWRIYTGEGELCGRLSVPEGLTLLEVLEGHVVFASKETHTVQVHEVEGLRAGCVEAQPEDSEQ